MRRKLNRIMALLLVVTSLFTLIPQLDHTAEATTVGEKVSPKRISTWYYPLTSIGRTWGEVGLYVNPATNEVMYCLDSGMSATQVTSQAGVPAKYAQYQNQIAMIAYYGYKRVDGVEYFLGKPMASTWYTTENAFVATQVLVWEFMLGYRSDYSANDGAATQLSSISYETGLGYGNILSLCRADATNIPQKSHLTISEAVKDNQHMVEGVSGVSFWAGGELAGTNDWLVPFDTITVEVGAAHRDEQTGVIDYSNYTLKGQKYTYNVATGAVTDTTGGLVKSVNVDPGIEWLKIQFDEERLANDTVFLVTYEKVRNVGAAGLWWWTGSGQGRMTGADPLDTVKAYMFITNEGEPDTDIIRIKKVDEEDRPLYGAEITVYDDQGQIVFSGETNNKGYIEFDKPPAGDYTFKETKPPEGYELNETEYSFTVDDDGTVTYDTLTIVNKKEGTTPKQPEVAIEENPPNFPMPSFTVRGIKLDKEAGHDGGSYAGKDSSQDPGHGSTSTPRGDATLAAGWDINWSGTGGASGSTTMYADHWGQGASATFRIWTNISQLNLAGTRTSTYSVGSGENPASVTLTTYYEYAGSGNINLSEIVPEGYLSEILSNTGTGTDSYSIDDINLKAQATDIDISGDDESGYTVKIAGWEYHYTITVDGKTSTYGWEENISVNESVGTTTWINRVQKGQVQLVKSYDQDLDPWSGVVGEKVYIEDSHWTLYLKDGGSENHKYIRVEPITQGEPGYDDYANCYRVTTDASGTAADKNNPLTTSKFGQLRVYDLPYGAYVMQEIRSDATEGYVLERVEFTVSEDGEILSYNVIDYVIENEIQVVKKNGETGKTVPYAGAAFRIRYMGNPLDEDPTQSPNYGRYIVNSPDIDDDGYQYVFYTDSNGYIKLPYALPFGLWQMEEIVAPEGYYIGRYGDYGVGQAVEGGLGYGDTVAIYDGAGNKVDYTADSNVVYNYYPFEVLEQDWREIMTITIEMVNNPVKGKIEVTKYGEELVGFNEVTAVDGYDIFSPVYEMCTLGGASFDIIAAEDITQFDGVDAPDAYDSADQLIRYALTQWDHALWPGALRLEEAVLEDGTELYYVTEADDDHSIATLLTAVRKGTTYTLVFETEPDGDGVVTRYTFTFGLEFAVGGWNYTDAVMTKEMIAPDFVAGFPESDMPELSSGTTDAALKSDVLGNGNVITVNDLVDQYDPVTADIAENAQVQYYALVEPELLHDYVPIGETLNTSVPANYTLVPGTGYHHYMHDTDGGYIIFVEDEQGGHTYIPCGEGGVEYIQPNIPGELRDLELEVESDQYILTDGAVRYVYTQAENTDSWTPATMWFVEEDDSNYDVGRYFWTPDEDEIPEGFSLSLVNIEHGYILYNEDESESMVYIHDHLNGMNRFVPCDGYRQYYLTATQHVDLSLIQVAGTEDGWQISWDEFIFSNVSEGEKRAVATFTNPFDAEPEYTLIPGATANEDGDTMTIEVPMAERSAYYAMNDGVEVWITYQGGYTKTSIKVPEGARIPVIFEGGSEADYVDLTALNPNNRVIEYTLSGTGNYIRTTLVEASQQDGEYRLIEIVHNATKESDAIKVEYPSGRESYSLVTYDPEAEQNRGQLVIEAETQTMVYKRSTVIETITTGEDGIAVSSLLPLGTYYVRESAVDAKGVVATNATHEVKLEYAGQYVPLIWGYATAENNAASVQLDISKVFQIAYDDDEYEPGAGAVFGVFAQRGITGAGSDTVPFDQRRVDGGDLLGVYTTDEDGKIVETLQLPFGHTYYVQEIEAPGYILTGDKYIFVVDETYYADGLQFSYDLAGISGKVTHTGLYTGEIEISTLYQVPSQKIVVNGEVIDTADAGTWTVSDMAISQQVQEDLSILTISGHNGCPIVIELESGAMITVNIYSDTYTVEFVDGKYAVDLNLGSSSNLSLESTDNGQLVTYNPVISYTGYTVRSVDEYVAPQTVLCYTNGVTVEYEYDAGGNRWVVIDFPYDLGFGDEVEAEPGTPVNPIGPIELPDYLMVDTENNILRLNLDGIDDGTYPLPFDGGSEEYGMDYISVIKNGASSSITAFGSVVAPALGYQPDGLTVSAAADGYQLAQVQRVISAHADSGTSSVSATLYYDNSMATVTTTGTVQQVYFGADPISEEASYTLNPGQNMTISMADGAVYCLELGHDRSMEIYLEDTIASAVNAGASPHSELNGASDNLLEKATGESVLQSFPWRSTTIDEIALKGVQSVTYARSDAFAKQLQVKINARQDNGMTAGDTGPTAPIENDQITVIIDKVDADTGGPLAGAVIALYDKSGEEVFRGVSDVSGEVVFQKVPAGTYTYRELTAPSGYELDTKTYTITVHEDGSVVGLLVLENKKSSTVTPGSTRTVIYKVDAGTGEFLRGAKIEVYNAATGKLVHSGTTNANGEIIIYNLPAGRYYMIEVEPPKGYYQFTGEIHFTVDASGRVVDGTTVMENIAQTTVIIDKTDVSDGEPVSGAEIAIYDEDGNEVFRGMTDQKGKLHFTPPGPGKYTFKEILAPDGYFRTETEFGFVVHEDGTITGVTAITNVQRPTIEISKTDFVTGSAVPGATIEITCPDGTTFSLVSDSQGKVLFTAPQIGRYTYREITAPEGYYLNKQEYSFEVHADGTVTGDAGITNVPYTTVIIDKADTSDGTPVPGAKIVIIDEAGNTIFEGVTDRDGKLYFVCPAPGTYIFQEIYSPDGYYLNEEEYTFTVSDDGSITGTTGIKNAPYTTVTLLKVDAKTDYVLGGARLAIYNAAGELVYEGVTDANGKLSYLVTEPGTYTVRELEPPEGYAITDEVWTFTIHRDGSVTGTTTIPNLALTDIPKTGGNALRLLLVVSTLGCVGGSVGALVYYRRKYKR